MGRRTYILGIVIVILLLAVGSCRQAGRWLVKDDRPEHADVMVMPTGTFADRVLQVADLYEKGVSEEVWIVQERLGSARELERRGVRVVSQSERARSAMLDLGIPPDQVLILPGDAASTQMEAESVRDFLGDRTDIDTIVLVTSSSHSRRAYYIFRAAFKNQKAPPVVACSPSPYSDFNPEKWWKSKEDIQDVVYEYLKLANFVLFDKRKLRKAGA